MMSKQLEDWGGFFGSRLISGWEIGKYKELQEEETVCAKALKWESMAETMSRWQKGKRMEYMKWEWGIMLERLAEM